MNDVLSIKNMSDIDALANMVEKDIGRIDDDDLIEYNNLLDKFHSTHFSKTVKTVEKGDSLENVVNFLFDKIGLFEVYANAKTSTHEIDQILHLNVKGCFFASNNMIRIPVDGFLGECKNYKKNVPQTWIGKFCTLLQSTHHTLGILFSYNGLTGKKWDDATGLTKKIYLLREDDSKKIKIVNFTYDDLKAIGRGDNFFKILNKKLDELRYGTDIQGYLVRHDAEGKWEKVINN